MKIFLDTADFGAIIERSRTGIISGVTTNPTLVRKQGVPYRDLIAQLCDCLLYTSPSPRDRTRSRMPSSA